MDVNEYISIGEIVARCVVMFLITSLIIWVTGMQSFRKNNPLDRVIAFLIGGVLSRGVVDATPFFSALAGSITLIFLQKLFYKLSFKYSWLETRIKGKRLLIYANGRFIKSNMQEADITRLEIFEDLRVELQTESLENIAEIFVEKTGEINFIKK